MCAFCCVVLGFLRGGGCPTPSPTPFLAKGTGRLYSWHKRRPQCDKSSVDAKRLCSDLCEILPFRAFFHCQHRASWRLGRILPFACNGSCCTAVRRSNETSRKSSEATSRGHSISHRACRTSKFPNLLCGPWLPTVHQVSGSGCIPLGAANAGFHFASGGRLPSGFASRVSNFGFGAVHSSLNQSVL